MMKRVFAAFLCLSLALSVFVGCDDAVHTHTYAEDWLHDAEGHWHEATCDCEEVPDNKEAHKDTNNDGLCDICEYNYNHNHSYSQDWTRDCTNHWHAADCGHIVAGAELAAHVDADGDKTCDVCLYVIEDIHEHYYSTEWTSDEFDHWHEALCEHAVEVSDKEAHVKDAAGYCTVCGRKIAEIDKTNLKAVLEAAIARNHMVIGGKILYDEEVFDGEHYVDVAPPRINKQEVYVGWSYDFEGTPSYIYVPIYNNVPDDNACATPTYIFNVPESAGIHSVQGYESGAAPEVNCDENYVGTSIVVQIAPGDRYQFYYGNADAALDSPSVRIDVTPVLELDNSRSNWSSRPRGYLPPATGTYTFTVPAGCGIWSVDDRRSDTSTGPEVDYATNTSGATFTVELQAGEAFAYYYHYVPEATDPAKAYVEIDCPAFQMQTGLHDDEIFYTLGEGSSYSTHIRQGILGGSVVAPYADQAWYQLLSLGETDDDAVVYGILSQDGGVTLERVAGAVANLKGYTYTPGAILGEGNSNTLEETLFGLYEIGVANSRGDFVQNYDVATGLYSFSYAYLYKNIGTVSGGEVGLLGSEYYEVCAEFSFDENDVLCYAAFDVISYRQEFDNDYTYDMETDTLTWNPGAAPTTYRYIVSQNSGARTYDSAYPQVSLIPKHFELYNLTQTTDRDEDGDPIRVRGELIGDTVTVDPGKTYEWGLADFVPVTLDATFLRPDDIQIILTNANNPDQTPTWQPYYHQKGSFIGLHPNSAGLYTMQIYVLGRLVKTVSINVQAPAATSIDAYVFEYIMDYWGTQENYEIKNYYTEYTIGVGEIMHLAPITSPRYSYQDYTYTLEIIEGSEAPVIKEVVWKSVYSYVIRDSYKDFTSLSFSSAAEGIYKLTFTSVSDPTLTTTLTITVDADYVGGGAAGSDEGRELIPGATYVPVKITDNHSWNNDCYIYTATIAGEYTFKVNAGLGIDIRDEFDSSLGTIDYMNPEFDSITINLQENQRVTIWCASDFAGDYALSVHTPETPEDSGEANA